MSVRTARIVAAGVVVAALAIPLCANAILDGPLWRYWGTHFPPGESAYVMMAPAGHLAFGLVFLQILAGSNAAALTAALGMPGLVGLHRRLGLVALALVLLHPILYVWGSSLRTGAVSWSALAPDPTQNYWQAQLFLGAVALYLVLAAVIAALLGRRLGERAWRWVHALNYAAFFAAFFHSTPIGNETRLWPVQGLRLAMVASVACALALRVKRAWVPVAQGGLTG